MISLRDGVHFSMVPFAVFNVADCFITCGVIALVIYILFFCREKKPAEKEPEDEADM